MNKKSVTPEFPKLTTARELFEVKGMKQKEIAKKVSVSEKTVGEWVLKYRWVKNNEMENKRKKAKQLFISQGTTQKEAAEMVGVSEKTVGTWAKKYNWKAGKKKQEEQNLTVYEFAAQFKEYVALFAPRYAGNTCVLVDQFLNSLET
jgi:transposase